VKRKLPVSLVIYCEALTGDEWSGVFKKMTGLDSLAQGHLTSAGSPESRELKQLLGVDPLLIKRSKDEGNRAITDGTLGQVTQSIQKTKLAVMTTTGPASVRVNPATAVEIKQYLERKGDRAANAKSVMIVIRPGN
jgi:hypothetical protein